jgi:hypothetical protein
MGAPAVNDWPDELEAAATAHCAVIRERLIAVHRSMDDWAVDFLAALDAHTLGKSVDKP